MRILFWNVDSAWSSALVQGGHEYLVPTTADRGPDGAGLTAGRLWSDAVTEVPVAALRNTDVDVVLLQRPSELALAADWSGRTPGTELPAIYVEHAPPPSGSSDERHPVGDRRDIPVVHVSQFNRLLWDTGTASTSVIEPGVLDPGPRYSGEVASGAVTLDPPAIGTRAAGLDLLPGFAAVGPVDLYGPGAAATALPGVAGHDDRSGPDDRLWEIARRRVYLQPARWSSPGIALIEAMQIGMPVLATATGSMADVVPSDAGVVSADIERLHREFRTMLNEPEIARFMGRQARRAALRRFGLVRFLDEWDAMLQQHTAHE